MRALEAVPDPGEIRSRTFAMMHSILADEGVGVDARAADLLAWMVAPQIYPAALATLAESINDSCVRLGSTWTRVGDFEPSAAGWLVIELMDMVEVHDADAPWVDAFLARCRTCGERWSCLAPGVIEVAVTLRLLIESEQH